MAWGKKATIGLKHLHQADATCKNNPHKRVISAHKVWGQRAVQYEFSDYYLDTQPHWVDKGECTSFERTTGNADLYVVHRQEPVHHRFSLPPPQEVQFYKHEAGGSNHLLLGSPRVLMNSLSAKKRVVGKACLYKLPLPTSRSNFVLKGVE